MNTHTLLSVFLASVLLALEGCNKSEETVVNPPSDSNLIVNGSFEAHGVPSLEGWTRAADDTSFINFSTDVPAGGGSFSVRLKNEWTFPGTISYNVVTRAGTHRYRLSAWAKAIRLGLFAGGEMAILVKTPEGLAFRKQLHFSDSNWISGSLLDTMTTVSPDTVVIMLRGNIDQWSYGYVLFDLCRFERLE